jgi:hypothetical protein
MSVNVFKASRKGQSNLLALFCSLMVITSGLVGLELPLDSKDADEENMKDDGGKTLLYVFRRG